MAKKTNKISKNIVVTTSTQTVKPTGWYNGTFAVKYDQAEIIGEFSGHRLYGYVAEEFAADPRWSNALSKGFARKAAGVNGIKLLDAKLFELKINDDARLCTSLLHHNDSGDYLVVFDNELDHKAVSRTLRATKALTVEEDYSVPHTHDHVDFEAAIIGYDTAVEAY